MKSLKYFFVAISFMLVCSISQGQRIAVLDFNAGAGISQADVDGISAIFNTYFYPKGYTLVERSQIDRVIDEQGFQRGRFTQKQMVRIGEILNVSKVVVGDISIVMGEYNVDVRVVNVESGTIAAKDGVTWDKNSSYREMMKQLAERISAQIAILPIEREPEKPKVVNNPLHRPTGGYLSVSAGLPLYASISYKHYLTSSFSVGGGVGYSLSCINVKPWKWNYTSNRYEEMSDIYWSYYDCLPIFAEVDLRTPRHEWSLFLNAKLGFNIYLDDVPEDHYSYYWLGHYREYYNFSPNYLYAAIAAGGSYKNLNLGIGISNMRESAFEILLNLFVSYDFPVKSTIDSLKETFF